MAIRPRRRTVRFDWSQTYVRYLGIALLVVIGMVGWRLHTKRIRTDAPPTTTDTVTSDFTVFISPGNGGSETGPVYPQNAAEPEVTAKDVTLAIAQATSRALAKEGIAAVLSRDGDTLVDALERRDRAMQVGAKLAIAIYLNENYNDPAQAGIELIDYKQVDWTDNYKQRQVFARELERALLDRLHEYGVASTGVYTRNSAFVPDMPTVVIEAGFISNDVERQRLATEEYQWQIANAITDAAVIYRDTLQTRGSDPTDLPAEEVVSRLHVPF